MVTGKDKVYFPASLLAVTRKTASRQLGERLLSIPLGVGLSATPVDEASGGRNSRKVFLLTVGMFEATAVLGHATALGGAPKRTFIKADA